MPFHSLTRKLKLIPVASKMIEEAMYFEKKSDFDKICVYSKNLASSYLIVQLTSTKLKM